MERKPKVDFTVDERKAMRLVANGGDVTSYAIAKLLRVVEAKAPHLIEITGVMGKYDGRGTVPYFGAILTDAGRKAVGRR